MFPELPPEAAKHALSLRLETPDDREFLARLYASTRAEELHQTGWPDEQKTLFLRQQFAAQTLHYDRFYATASRLLILVHGQPAGRLYLYQMERELRIVDISLLPEHRRHGIGTILLRAVLGKASSTASKVSVHVEFFSPAKRLYERLGFVATSLAESVYVLMECG